MGGIYHNKKCAQGKAGQGPMCQSLQKNHFVYNVNIQPKHGLP